MTVDLFEGRKLVIATKHEKEKVIAPLFESELDVHCFVPENFDTDSLGTFSGEIERKNTPLETARLKCKMAMEQTNCDLGIATEGSFGPHPSLFFAHANDELIIFMDAKNNLEIVVREISLETNFNATTANNYFELEIFAKNVKFPSHAIILKSNEKEVTTILKGINSWELLKESHSKLTINNSTLVAETDMRALYNPSRMKIIEIAAQKLLEKIKSVCPNCATPGFGVVSAISGLPCEWCGRQTKSIRSHLYSCKKCDFQKEELFPNGKQVEDPTYCDYCNP